MLLTNANAGKAIVTLFCLNALLKSSSFKANAAAAPPPYPSRASRTESFNSRTGDKNSQSTKKKLFVDIDSQYTGSEDEFADLCRILSPMSNTSSKTHRDTTHVQISKRDRATHVHNLSEKRRRNRINDKLKALQLLIPNSQKTDKASILQEVIEYVKQLQLQVQILSSPNKTNPSHISVPMGIPFFQMPQMCMNTNSGFMGMGVNMAHSHSQWNNGFMTEPQGVQGQTIPPWANQQNKE